MWGFLTAFDNDTLCDLMKNNSFRCFYIKVRKTSHIYAKRWLRLHDHRLFASIIFSFGKLSMIVFIHSMCDFVSSRTFCMSFHNYFFVDRWILNWLLYEYVLLNERHMNSVQDSDSILEHFDGDSTINKYLDVYKESR
jgi:hypothetical protein